MLGFLDVRDVSHIRSVNRHPELAASAGNVVFEPPKWNQGRGPRDMGFPNKLRVHRHSARMGLGAARRPILAASRGAAQSAPWWNCPSQLLWRRCMW